MAHNILIVDDSSVVRKIIRRAISNTQLEIGEIHEAGDGVEAMNILRQHTFDAVLTDLNMPNMNGRELLAAIKAEPQWKDLPVMLITTETRLDDVLDAVNKGATGYIKKPFTPSDIENKLIPILTR
jgi:two-component system, chemotaxis family, chemotaxis protein CheY